MTKFREFTRKELYDLVSATPMVKLAKEFGMSDVGLRKICVKHDIPTPPLGYWAKLSFGRAAKSIPLTAPRQGVSDLVQISIHAVAERPSEVVQAEIEARQRISEPIGVPMEAPAHLHSFARALKRALKASKPNPEGFCYANGHGILSTSVGAGNRDRVVLLADTLFRTLEAAGQQVKAAEKDVHIVVDGEAVRIQIGEIRDKREHQPSKAELKAKQDWETRRKEWPTLYNADRQHWRRWDHVPSGRMSLTLVDPLRNQWQPDHVIGRWHDRSARRLEDYLQEIVIGIITGAAIVRHNRIASETAERKRQQAHEAYLAEQQRLREQAARDKFLDDKANDVARLNGIMALREHVSQQHATDSEREQDETLRAADDLIERL
ncbi:MAG TPA: hypothetical protein VMT72_09280, partial [Pseudolabrys sp.]|nr:hypothetical protein [Pseudolabrys sp.]